MRRSSAGCWYPRWCRCSASGTGGCRSGPRRSCGSSPRPEFRWNAVFCRAGCDGLASVAMDRPLAVLLVEDNPVDCRLTTETLKKSGLTIRLYVVGSGEEALDFLHGRSEQCGAAERPDLVLLDLGLPGISGQE